MNPLQFRLASLRRRMILVNFWRGSCTLLAAVLGILLVEGLLDWRMHLPAPIRGLFLIGLIVALVTVFVRCLYNPLTKRLDDLSLALRIEEIYPELNDNLATAVQFLDEPEENLPGSKIMRKHTIEDALKRADHCDFSNIIDRRGVFLRPVVAVLIALTAAHFLYHHTAFACLAETRLVDPFGGHSWTQVEVEAPPPFIAKGQRYVIKGKVAGIIPKKGKLEVEGITQLDKSIPILEDSDPASFQMPLDNLMRAGKIRFRITANDGTYPAHGGFTDWIEIADPPKLLPSSQQIELDYPAYTDLRSPERLSPGLSQFEAVAGTQVRWKGTVDRPVVAAWVEQGATRIPCQIDASGKQLAVEFTPPATTLPATIRFKDRLGLGNADEDRIDMNIFVDPPPLISMHKPEWKFDKVLPGAQITVDLSAVDKQYSLRNVYLEYRRKGVNDEGGETDWQRIPIVQADAIGLFALFAQDAAMRMPVRVRPTQLDFSFAWQLHHKFKEGELVSFRLVADDFNKDCKPIPSRTADFLVVSEREFKQELDAQFEKVQRPIEALRKALDEAIQLVKEVKEAEGKKDADVEALREKLIAAAKRQAEIKDYIRALPDGMSKQLADLAEKIHENKLPPSDLQKNIKVANKQLDNLVRVDPVTKQQVGLLPQIEDDLENALRQLTQPEGKSGEKGPKDKTQPKPKPMGEKQKAEAKGKEGKDKKPLDQARAAQDEAKKILADLDNFLAPWAGEQEIKDRIIKLHAQQKSVKTDTEALRELKSPPRDQLLGRAEQQEGLAKEADELLVRVGKVMEKQKGTDTGDKLEKVAMIAKEFELPKKMRAIQTQLAAPKPNLGVSIDNQEAVVKTLEEMLAALDEKSLEDKIERLKPKQKKAKQDLDNLENRIAQMDKKVAEARKIADPQQRDAALKKLGKEKQKIEEDARQLARDLARLEAEKAARDLENLADELEKARLKMQKGEDPGEEEKNAKENLEKAKADLEQAREELARENNALIADKLTGIKLRQDECVGESERIHRKLVQENQWSPNLHKSLGENGETQTGLAGDAVSFKKKLANGLVFEHILMDSVASMEKAAEAIKQRAKAAKVGFPLDKGELAAENNHQEKIIQLQSDASEQLGWLVDALKQDANKRPPPPPKKKPEKKGEDDGKQDPMQKKTAKKQGDGIPSDAELELLGRMQDRALKRTRDFNKRFGDRKDLTDDQLEELRGIEQKQREIQELFNRVMQPPKGADE